MASRTKNAQRIRRVPKRALKCVYCNRKLIRSEETGRQFHPDMATIDHLYSRMDIRRFIVKDSDKYVVLSCMKCNQRLALEERKVINDWYAEHIAAGPKVDIFLRIYKFKRYTPNEDEMIMGILQNASRRKIAATFCSKKLHRTPNAILKRFYKLCAAKPNTTVKLLSLVS